MTKYTFTPQGVCSRAIEFELDNGIIRNISFQGGCHGNLQGIARLADNEDAARVAGRLAGIKCRKARDTSCPDQLACAIREYNRPAPAEDKN
jgi:uncharacterized protein (TIGR03905 family)